MSMLFFARWELRHFSGDNHRRVEEAALKLSVDLDEQIAGAHAEIVSILVETGALDAIPSGNESIKPRSATPSSAADQ